MTKNKVRKVGSSLVISLPKAILDLYKIKEGDYITFEMNGIKGFTIRKV